MQERIADRQAEGMRLDKYLRKLLPQAPDSFLYRMLRKKNIVVNDQKAAGSLLIHEGDRIRLYLSDETISSFSAGEEQHRQSSETVREAETAYRTLKGVRALEETEDVVFLHKSAGVLSQKADQAELSANEWLIGYLLAQGKISPDSLQDFRPAVCNRLDRGTDGILIGAATRQGAREMTRLIRERGIRKYYQMIVLGRISEPGEARNLLVKDRRSNRTRSVTAPGGEENALTVYRPLESFTDRTGREVTLVEAELVTGRSHQLRVQFSAMGHPIAGDAKYGDAGWNEELKKTCGIRTQVLSCIRVEFPDSEQEKSRTLKDLSGRVIRAGKPESFEKIR